MQSLNEHVKIRLFSVTCAENRDFPFLFLFQIFVKLYQCIKSQHYLKYYQMPSRCSHTYVHINIDESKLIDFEEISSVINYFPCMVFLHYKGQIFGSSQRKWHTINLNRCFNPIQGKHGNLYIHVAAKLLYIGINYVQ